MMLFELGKIVSTYGVATRMRMDEKFARDVEACVVRHATRDWGDLCDEDKELNDQALDAEKTGGYTDRIFSAYELKDSKIYIITEWDRSVTTVLFPEEY